MSDAELAVEFEHRILLEHGLSWAGRAAIRSNEHPLDRFVESILNGGR